MGADRKGPLAAFIVVAIIAAILLITSVRSQAATGWLGRAVPSTPEVVRSMGGGLGRLVGQRSDAPASSPQSDQPTTRSATHRPADPPSRHPTHATVRATTRDSSASSTRSTAGPTAGPAPHAVRVRPGHVHPDHGVTEHGRHLGRPTHARR